MATSAWQAKLDRAVHHLADLREATNRYLRSDAWSVQELRAADTLTLVLRIRRPPPLELSTIVGDALHNMRSSLDAVMFALTTQAKGEPLTEDEEGDVSFPISRCQSSMSFEQFASGLRRKGKAHVHEYLPAQVVETVYQFQPFFHNGQYERVTGKALSLEEQAAHVRWHHLTRLNQLSNIDKHRRLHLTFVYPQLIWYSSDGKSTPPGWRPGDRPPHHDGSVIGTYVGGQGVAMPTHVNHDMVLTLGDLPDNRSVVDTLAAMLDAVRYPLHALAAHLEP